jgi:polar amino acid transport system substrate-binding protein
MKIFTYLILYILFTQNIFADTKRVVLTTLNWPPYTGYSIKDGGVMSAIVEEAFEKMEYNLKIEYHPWKRALALSKNNKNYDGVFPAYYSDDRAKDYYISDPIGSSTVGFAQRKNSPILYRDLRDLKKYSIGVVSGYVNEKEFDKLVSKKLLKVKPVSSDLINLKKLINKRLDTLVIDKLNMQYLISKYHILSKNKDNIEFNQKALEIKPLYVLFKKTKEGKELLKEFNRALKEVDIAKIEQEYFN